MKRTSVILLLLVIIFVFTLFSCSKSYESNRLFIDVPDIEHTGVTDANIQVVCDALDRLNIICISGKLYTFVESGKQANMSQGLYDYIMGMLSRINTSGFNLEEYLTKDGNVYMYSCVSFAISHMVGGPTFYDADSWIRTEFPQHNGGVPSNRIGYVMTHFFDTNSLQGWSEENVPDEVPWSSSNTVGIYYRRDGNGVIYGHMVNIMGKTQSGDYYQVKDYSLDSVDVDYPIPSYAMKYIYYLNAVDSLTVIE